MTHTEESLMALADDYGREIADCPNMPTPVERKICTEKIEQAREALRLAIREVLAELANAHGVAQACEARAEKAEAERDELRKDAERWRKASTSRNYGITDYTQFGVRTIHGTLAEEVIDAAMKEQP